MKDILVTYDTAKLAYQHGFDESTPDSYIIFGKADRSLMENPVLLGCEDDLNEIIMEKQLHPYHDVCCPTQALLREWLRMEHFIHIIIIPYGFKNFGKDFVNPDDTYSYGVYDNTKYISSGTDLRSYEDALEVALRDGLRLVTEENHKIID
jgi:hypothetical protein